MLILFSNILLKHGSLEISRSLQTGLRKFSSNWSLKQEHTPPFPASEESDLISQHEVRPDSQKPWMVSFYLNDPTNAHITTSLPRPDRHPFEFFHAKLYPLPKSFIDSGSQYEEFVGNVRERIHDFLTSGFSIQKYAERIARDLEGPDGNRLKSSSWFSMLPQSGCTETSEFVISVDRREQSVMLSAYTGWPSMIHGLKSSKSGRIALKTGHALCQLESHKSDESSADDRSEPEAASAAQASTRSSDLIGPVFRLHRAIKDFLGESFEENNFLSKLRSACRMSFQVADEDPHCKRLQLTKIQVLRHSSRKRLRGLSPARLSRAEYEQDDSQDPAKTTSTGTRRVYIAMGSNIGHRVRNIESACDKMTQRGIFITRTSALYETQPMYLEDQALFLNCVCEANTALAPLQLLDQLKEIEAESGREETVRNGPRVIDLDILLYELATFESDRLSIPHKKMMERQFVLRPLCDLIPGIRHPGNQSTFLAQLKELEKSSPPLSPLTPILEPIHSLKSQEPSRLTNIMTILNMTPDSFSDGGVRYNEDPKAIVSKLKRDLDMARGTHIIDIGGQSTRPNATQIPEEEELARILPIIKVIGSDPFFANVAISVDTYRASVASAAIKAGANIVNDISAGLLDPQMIPTVASLGCTYILMHTRGTPQTMSSLTDYPSGIVNGVASELRARIRAAEAAGIRRWRMCLDPGIGFAKTPEQSLELVRRFHQLRNVPSLRGFPWVVGVSRKGFIGKVTGVENADQRDLGTAVAVTAVIQGGADIVRVHDTEKMSQVVKMADAIWRSPVVRGG